LVKKKKEPRVLTEFLKVLPSFLRSTGGSLLIFFMLLPFVLGQLIKSLPALAGVFATVSNAIRDPAQAAHDIGEAGADTLLAAPSGFFGGIVASGFGIGEAWTRIFGTGGPTTPEDDRELTYCERLGNDLVLIERALSAASGLGKISPTYAYAAKLYDIKKAGCGKPAFISQNKWDRVPG